MIHKANKEVSAIMAGTINSWKRSAYLKVSAEKKAQIGKYASEYGIMSVIWQYAKDFPVNSLKESTVRGWLKSLKLSEGSKQVMIL